ncbi:MAG: cytochrome ubiquinol oxidase subunit I [Paenibacillaceae bacterium]
MHFPNDPETLSRILTGLTIGFHIIYATIGVGVPLMIALAEWIGIRRKDNHYVLLAKRLTRGFVITVAVGVVTGTAIGFMLSLLWPSFMQIAVQAIALPLFMEIFAFFFEAIFLGIYLYTWDRFKKQTTHFLLVIPVVLGSSAFAFFITTVKAFMNTPQGFTIQGNRITDINPLIAMFNPATPTEVSHVLISSYMTSAYILASIAAFSLLRKRDHVYYKKALKLAMVAALVFSVAAAAGGDLSGKFLAIYQPEKLAAAEWHFETKAYAPLVLGGYLNQDNEIKFGLEIPYALGVLAHNKPSGVVIGINDYPEDERPPLYVHYLFDGMVSIGVFLILISLLYSLALVWPKWNPYNRLLLRCILWGGPLAMIAIECGWIYAEISRQPWILRGYMRTSQGATTSEHVDLILILFASLYVLLGFTSIKVLRRLFHNHPAEAELAAMELTVI